MKLIVFGDFKLENIKNESHVQKKYKVKYKILQHQSNLTPNIGCNYCDFEQPSSL